MPAEQAHCWGQAFTQAGLKEVLVARSACEEIFLVFRPQEVNFKCQPLQRLFLFCICFDFSISKALRPPRPPLGAGEGSSLSGLHICQLWAWNLLQDFWDCPVSLLGRGWDVTTETTDLEDLAVHKGTSALDKQGMLVRVEEQWTQALLPLSFLYNTSSYSWTVGYLPGLWKLHFWNFQLPASFFLFPSSFNPPLLRLCWRQIVKFPISPACPVWSPGWQAGKEKNYIASPLGTFTHYLLCLCSHCQFRDPETCPKKIFPRKICFLY